MYYLYNNTSRNIPQDIFGKFDKKNKPIKAFGGFLFFISVKQPDKSKYDNNERIKNTIDEGEALLGDSGRIVVRPSGTEPLIRVMVEGEQEDLINKVADNVAKVIEEELK